MNVQFITDFKGRKKGIFLSLADWNSVQKQLELLQSKVSSIEKRRNQILTNLKKSKGEKHIFSSDIRQLKSILK
jgi:peptidoglycan hydrolase CwlO-like protein